ncbi:12581_t:CDS:2, partial [Cetraspora pellucida]
ALQQQNLARRTPIQTLIDELKESGFGVKRLCECSKNRIYYWSYVIFILERLK